MRKKQQQISISREVLDHETLMIDAYRRLISAISTVLICIEKQQTEALDRNMNDLDLQTIACNIIFYDPQFEGMHQELMGKLKKDFGKETSKIPKSFDPIIGDRIAKGRDLFRGPIKYEIPLYKKSDRPMTDEQGEVFMFNMAIIRNADDKQAEKYKDCFDREKSALMTPASMGSFEENGYLTNYQLPALYRDACKRQAHEVYYRKASHEGMAPPPDCPMEEHEGMLCEICHKGKQGMPNVNINNPDGSQRGAYFCPKCYKNELSKGNFQY